MIHVNASATPEDKAKQIDRALSRVESLTRGRRLQATEGSVGAAIEAVNDLAGIVKLLARDLEELRQQVNKQS